MTRVANAPVVVEAWAAALTGMAPADMETLYRTEAYQTWLELMAPLEKDRPDGELAGQRRQHDTPGPSSASHPQRWEPEHDRQGCTSAPRSAADSIQEPGSRHGQWHDAAARRAAWEEVSSTRDDGGGGAESLGSAPARLLSLHLLDVMIDVVKVPGDATPCEGSCEGSGGSGVGRVRAPRGAFRCSSGPSARDAVVREVELATPAQALVLLLWTFRTGLAQADSLVVYQPAVMMTPAAAAQAQASLPAWPKELVPGDAGPGAGGAPQPVKLLACQTHQLPSCKDPGYKWNRIRERMFTITATSKYVPLTVRREAVLRAGGGGPYAHLQRSRAVIVKSVA